MLAAVLSTALLLPGHAQNPYMGAELYAGGPPSGKRMDECADFVRVDPDDFFYLANRHRAVGKLHRRCAIAIRRIWRFSGEQGICK